MGTLFEAFTSAFNAVLQFILHGVVVKKAICASPRSASSIASSRSGWILRRIRRAVAKMDSSWIGPRN